MIGVLWGALVCVLAVIGGLVVLIIVALAVALWVDDLLIRRDAKRRQAEADAETGIVLAFALRDQAEQPLTPDGDAS